MLTLDTQNIEDVLALTPTQQGMLFHYLTDENSNYYFNQVCLELEGNIQTRLFKKAWSHVVHNNEMLRTVYRWEKIKAPLQLVLKQHRLQLQYHNLAGKSSAEKTRLVEAIKQEDREAKFDLRSVPFRVALIKTGPDQHVMMLSNHHILFDGWSRGNILKEFLTVYGELSRGNPPPVRTRTKFKEYVKWVQSLERGRDAQEAFWKDYLRGFGGNTSLPAAAGGRAAKRKKESKLTLPEDLVNQVTRFSKQYKITLSTLVYAAWSIVLQAGNNASDVAFGVTLSGRWANVPDIEEMVGLFINTLPLRVKSRPSETKLELLQKIQDTVLLFEKLASVPLADLKKFTEVGPGAHLFDSIVVVENFPLDPGLSGAGNAPRIRTYAATGHSNYNLTVLVLLDRGIEVSFVYNENVFAGPMIEALKKQFVRVIEALTTTDSGRVAEINLLAPEERQELLELGRGRQVTHPGSATVVTLFEEQVRRHPDRVGVVFGEAYFSYGWLNRQANQLAALLTSKGVGPEVIVGLLLERSPRMIVSMLAVLKAGGAYLPIDPAYPRERIGYLRADSGCQVVIDEETLRAWTAAAGQYDGRNAAPVNAPGDLAYVIYTSGSTGRPKGVLVEHASLVNYLRAMGDKYGIGPADKVLQISNFAFDASVEQILLSLLNGAELCIAGKSLVTDPAALTRYLREREISHLHAVPTLLQSMPLATVHSLKRIVSAGETCPASLPAQAKETAAFFNKYGPTEATISAAIYGPHSTLTPGMSVPIGGPIDNVSLYLLNQTGELTPRGCAGELCIGGAGVARGYLNQVELTHEKFVNNPYGPGRLYRSGDVARWQQDGQLEYLGRQDEQVKLRGYRIELGEIGQQLESHPQVKQAVVLVRQGAATEPQPADKQLVAYLVARGFDQQHQQQFEQQLRAYLRERLPEYMVPARMVVLESFPLTANGKLDRKALPAPAAYGAATSAPATPLEQQLQQVWASVLGLEPQAIGVEDDFFALGGHSLKATLLAGQLHKQAGVKIPLAELFNRPTIRQQAAYVQNQNQPQEAYQSIEAAPRQDHYPLTSGQKRLYVLQQLSPESRAYNMPYPVVLKGDLDYDRVEAAFASLIERHESLRTSLLDEQGQVSQRVHPQVDFRLQQLDLREELRQLQQDSQEDVFSSPEQQALLEHHVQSFIAPFRLEEAPLLRALLIECAPALHVLAVDLHHVVSDQLSSQILLADFVALYQQQTLPPLRIQYKDYAYWQQSPSQQERLQQQRAYWLQALAQPVPPLELPLDFARPGVQSFRGAGLSFVLDEQTSQQLRSLAQGQETTLFMVVVSLYSLWLGKLSGQDHLRIGTPVVGRCHADLEPIVGMFTNTLVLSTPIEPQQAFLQLLGEVKQQTLLAFEHQEYPYEELVSELVRERDPSRNPLFDVMLNYQHGQSKSLSLSGLEIDSYPFRNQTTQFDIVLQVQEEGKALRCTLTYCSELWKAETMQRWAGYFQHLAAQVAARPTARLGQLPLLDQAEREQVLAWSQGEQAYYPKSDTVVSLFQEQVSRHPDRVGVVFGEAYFSYGWLNQRANQLASLLTSKGVGPEVIVGLLLERSPQMIVSILAVLKAGGAYLPIDPAYPLERINYLLADSNAALVLGQKQWLDPLTASQAGAPAVLLVDVDEPANYPPASQPLPGLDQPRQMAYLIYTSGSTGRPKAVVIEHHSLVNRLWWMQNSYPLDATDTVLQKTPYTFDVSVWELLWWGLAGARVCLLGPGQQKDPQAITQAVEVHQVSTLHFVPPMLEAFLRYLGDGTEDHRLGSLRQVFASGEALPLSQVRRFAGTLHARNATRLVNLYGPTEATIDVSYYNCCFREQNVPIGRPISNTSLYVLDGQMQLQPLGVSGELCIGGVGVARGYLNQVELTHQKFVDNPYGQGRLYRTGDVSRWQEDGELEYLGRQDEQVKLRGYRIELGEIGQQLESHPQVKQAVVMVRQDEGRDKQLVAYMTSDAPTTSHELREYLRERLPEYMIPNYFAWITEIPLTKNGKVDRQVLPPPADDELEESYVAPRNDVERKLVEVWQETLNIPMIGIKDNYFSIGGDSITAIQIISKLGKEGYKIDLRDFFLYPTVMGMSPLVEKTDQVADQSLVMGRVPLTPIQTAVLARNKVAPSHYNQGIAIALAKDLDEAAVTTVFNAIQEHHDALRMTFRWEGDRWVQTNQGMPYPVGLQSYDLEAVADEAERNRRIKEAASLLQRSMDLENGPLLKVGLFKLREVNLAVIITHHLISDGVSWRILLEDLGILFEQYRRNERPQLPPKTTSYKVWSEKISEYANSEAFLQEKQYWRRLESVDVPPMPQGTKPEVSYLEDRATCALSLNEEDTRLLLTVVNHKFGAEINDVLLTALAQAVMEQFAVDKVAVDLEGHGRESIMDGVDVSRTVGWFTSSYPVILNLSSVEKLWEQIDLVKNTLRKIPHKGVGYGILKYLTRDELKKDITFKTRSQISFNYLGQVGPSIQGTQFKMASVDYGEVMSGRTPTVYDLDIDGITLEGRLTMRIHYNRHQYSRELIGELCDRYSRKLADMIAYCL